MTQHEWFIERIATYLAGGLDEAEAARFAAHRESCASCAAVAAEGERADRALRELFAGAGPAEGFEDKLVESFRQSRRQWALLAHPAVVRIGSAVAAALILGGVGLTANYVLDRQERPAVATKRTVLVRGGKVSLNKTYRAYGWVDYVTDASGPVSIPDPAEKARELNGRIEARLKGDKQANQVDALVEGVRNAVKGDIHGDGTRDGGWGYKAGDEKKDEGRNATHDEMTKSRPSVTETDGRRTHESTISNQKAELEKSLVTEGRRDGIDSSDRLKLAPTSDTKVGAGAITLAGKEGGHSITAPTSLTLGGASTYSGNAIVDGSALTTGTVSSDSPGNTVQLGGAITFHSNAGGTLNLPADTGGTVNGTLSASSGKLDLNGHDTGVSIHGAVAEGKSQEQPGGAVTSYRYAGVGENGKAPAATYFRGYADDSSKDGKETEGLKGARKLTGNGTAVALADTERPVGADSPPPTGPASGSPKSADPAASKAAPPVDPAVKAAQEAAALRKIIRNGDMEFEVEAFDSAFVQIAKIVEEERGFVASNNSEKLPNGKVKGTIIVRVPPEHLDVLVLKLRALGELKSQRIVAQDITKQYTDMASELRAARAMEARLLDIIKSGKGEIKDLLEAEKQLGTWREKIEKIEGEVRYYDNLVALSTLQISLAERDIRAPQYAAETEQVSMGVDCDDVEKTYADAQKAITEAKGRVIASDLKKYDAGQLQARIECAVAPESAGPLIDRLKQLGRVSRLDIERKQTTGGGTGAPAGIKVERKETIFSISLFNIANIAPRETVNLSIAAEDVETVYRDIIAIVEQGGSDVKPSTTQPAAKPGRIVSSSLNRQRADQINGNILFEVPSADAGRIQELVRAKGEVMRLTVTENADTNNVTRAKRGFNVQVASMNQVQPRETTTIAIAATKVPDAYRSLQDKIADLVTKRKARVLGAQLNEQDRANVTGTLDFEVQRPEAPAIITMLGGLGDITSRNVARSADMENTVDSKVRLQISFTDEARLSAREATRIVTATKNVPDAYYKLLDAVHQVGRVINSQINEQDRDNITGIVDFDIPRSERAAIEKLLEPPVVEVLARSVTRAADAQNTTDKKIHLTVYLNDEVRLVARETTTMKVVAMAVPEAYAKVLELARAKGRVLTSTLNEQNRDNANAVLEFEVPQDQRAAAEQLIGGLTDITTRSVTRSQDQQSTTEKKVRLHVTFANAQQQPPRLTTTVMVEVPEVRKALRTIASAAEAAGGGVTQPPQVGREDTGEVKGTIVIDVPIAKSAEVRQMLENELGNLRVSQPQPRTSNVSEGKFTRDRFDIVLANPETIVPANDGVGASIKSGLQTVVRALAWAVKIIIVGLLFVLPCLLVLAPIAWLVRRFIRQTRTKPATSPAAA